MYQSNVMVKRRGHKVKSTNRKKKYCLRTVQLFYVQFASSRLRLKLQRVSVKFYCCILVARRSLSPGALCFVLIVNPHLGLWSIVTELLPDQVHITHTTFFLPLWLSIWPAVYHLKLEESRLVLFLMTQQANLPSLSSRYPILLVNAKQGSWECQFSKFFGLTRLRNRTWVFRVRGKRSNHLTILFVIFVK